jgi:uncharacterized protein (DUF2237 family)
MSIVRSSYPTGERHTTTTSTSSSTLTAAAAITCVQVTEDFLAYTASKGNDLSTPVPGMFPGLKPGDRWCLCASR